METDRKMNQSRLFGRRIVIAGAASGIGKATARLFAEHGTTLALIVSEMAWRKSHRQRTPTHFALT
jgi:NAD(P)-dependent dehydrogenase (short-subunit alcohol dehydrogenase family)